MSVATLANRSVTLQRPTVTRDAAGGHTIAWANVAKLQGRVQPLSSRETIMHSKDDSRVSHKGYFSGTPDIRATDRMDVGLTGRSLYVVGVRNIDLADVFTTVELDERDDGD